jgi:hypothetical protein
MFIINPKPGTKVFHIYRIWTDSNHKICYTAGFYSTYEEAKMTYDAIFAGQTACAPPNGIEKITVFGDVSEIKQEIVE